MAARFRRAAGLSVLTAIGLCATVAPRGAEAPIDSDTLSKVFPGATEIGAFAGTPPAAPAYRGTDRIGYVFSTHSVSGSVGFAGRPLDIVVGLGNDGRVAGAFLREHGEPILVIGIPESHLHRYVSGFAGLDPRTIVRREAALKGFPDAISGATISSAIIRDVVLRSARAVAASRGLFGAGQRAHDIDRTGFTIATWEDLVRDGSLARLKLTQRPSGKIVPAAEPDAPFIDLYLGLITPPRIGQNLLGAAAFNRVFAGLGPADHAILIAANGLYSFKGTAHVRTGRFERIQIAQDGRTIALTRQGYVNVERLAIAGAPDFREIGVFVLPAASGFDGLRPWRLSLLADGAGDQVAAFEVPFMLPDRYRLPDAVPTATPRSTDAAATEIPLWRQIWQARSGRIAGLIAMLLTLTGILVFQDWVVADARRYRVVRLAFLATTLVWLGWYAGAQLSVVHVLTFVHSILRDFKWEFFLVDPLVFILWGYVAVTLLFWGRGVFCGWLCPFGALQELLNETARALKIPQIKIPFAVHERIWPLKYIVFIGLLAVSLNSTELAVYGAEFEPFKTAITLKFARTPPFMLYAVGLLVVGMFIERAFCRYLCPLGGALAIPARLRMFEWLKRRHQCGVECAVCAQRCTVQAIHPTGEINPNECVYCLNCQTLYHDDHVCPPLVAKRRRREARLALSSDHGPSKGA